MKNPTRNAIILLVLVFAMVIVYLIPVPQSGIKGGHIVSSIASSQGLVENNTDKETVRVHGSFANEGDTGAENLTVSVIFTDADKVVTKIVKEDVYLPPDEKLLVEFDAEYVRNRTLPKTDVLINVRFGWMENGMQRTMSTGDENKGRDCGLLRQDFDEYIEKSTLPVMENPDSLCYGLNTGTDFSKLTPRWAIGKLINISADSGFYSLTFEGINETGTFRMHLNDTEAASYETGKYYRIDMNNICRSFFEKADSRYPSPISSTFLKPEEIECI